MLYIPYENDSRDRISDDKVKFCINVDWEFKNVCIQQNAEVKRDEQLLGNPHRLKIKKQN